jgi:error-prone DNA polymerase
VAKLRGTKHDAPVRWADLADGAVEGLFALTGDEEGGVRRLMGVEDFAGARAYAEQVMAAFGRENVAVEIQRHLRRGEEYENERLFELAACLGLPPVATNGVLHATAEDRPVMDVFTCAREHTHLDIAGKKLAMNAERYLKEPMRMRRLFRDHQEALTNTLRIAERMEFSLKDLGYEFPRYPVSEGESMDTFLRKVTMAGARARYSHLGGKVMKQVNHELELIAKLGFSGYFLIVWDIVNFCTSENILVQGRGSAANSVVCYALGITACDPIACSLFFERFLSEGRTSWPDIDLDLPSGDRRERVIQEVYRREREFLRFQRLVHCGNLSALLGQPRLVLSAGNLQPLRVIRDADVFIPSLDGRRSHLRDRAASITPFGVHLQIASQLRPPCRLLRQDFSGLGQGEKLAP